MINWERTRVATNSIGLPGFGALFQPDGQALWMAKNLRNASLLRMADSEPLLALPKGLLPLALTEDGRHLAVSVEGRRLQVWNLPELRGELKKLGLDW